MTDNSALVYNLSGAQTFGGVISGSGSLTQAGTGILTLMGSNPYTGGTTISAGTLQVGNGGSGASIGNTSSLLDNGSLVFNHSDAVTFSPAVSGSGSLTQTGTGVLTLTGSNNSIGSTTISGGALQVGNGSNLNLAGALTLAPSTAVAVANGGQINLSGGTLSIANQALLTVSNGAALTTAGPTYVNSAGTLLANGGTSVLTANGDVTISGGNLLVNGAFSLGSGHTLTIQNNGLADFAQGPFFLDQGTTAHIASGGTLQNVSQLAVAFSGLGKGSLSVDGSNTVVAAGALLVGGGGASGSATFSGSSTSWLNYMGLAADFFPGTSAALTITSGAAVNLAGALDLADAGGNATGSILLTGAGSRLTQTSSASALILGSGAFGSASLTVASGATFSALGPITVNSPAVFNISGGSAIIQGLLAGNVTDDSTLEFVPAQSFNYTGDISGSGNLMKDGPLSLILSGSNTYAGGTMVDDGMLYATNSDALPNESSLTVGAGGMFIFDPSAAGASLSTIPSRGASPGLTAVPVPEPGTFVLLGVAAFVAAAATWRSRRNCK